MIFVKKIKYRKCIILSTNFHDCCCKPLEKHVFPDILFVQNLVGLKKFIVETYTRRRKQ